MKKNNPYQALKGSDIKRTRQAALLLGPTNGGKTELLEALKSLRKLGVTRMSRLFANPDDPKFKMAESQGTHAIETTSNNVGLDSRPIRLFKSSLTLKDGAGDEEARKERIESFVKNQIVPKPKRWRDGALAIVVFNVSDILVRNADNMENVEASYREAVEIWGENLYPSEEEEVTRQAKDQRNSKKKINRTRIRPPFHPPFAILFVASHLDEVDSSLKSEARQAVRGFVKEIVRNGRIHLEIPETMPPVEARFILADLNSLQGRLQFALDFYKARADLSKVMKEEVER